MIGTGRRLTFKIPGGTTSFSVGPNVSDAEAILEVLRLNARVERGFARTIISIDGGEGIRWACRVAASYIVMWATIGWRHTFGRRAADARIRAYAEALTPTDAQSGEEGQVRG